MIAASWFSRRVCPPAIASSMMRRMTCGYASAVPMLTATKTEPVK